MKLAYYSQLNTIKRIEDFHVPLDLHLAANEFKNYFTEVSLLLHHSNKINRTALPCEEPISVFDLGLNVPLWKRLFGLGIKKNELRNHLANYDAIIIQCPTPLTYWISRLVNPKKTKLFFLVVGTMAGSYPGQFRPYGIIKHYLIKVMVVISDILHKKAFKQGIVLANNHSNVERFAQVTPSYLVSKALVKESEIRIRELKRITGDVKLLYYGRVEPDKHIETILKACSILKIQGQSFRLKIVGDALDSYKEFLVNLRDELSLDDEVTFVDGVGFYEKERHFNESDIFIFHTCGTEGFPRVIWESFANGVPVIAANYPGATGYFTHKKEVMLFERKDYKTLAKNIELAIKDEKLRQYLITNGRELLRQNTLEIGHKHISEIIKQHIKNV